MSIGLIKTENNASHYTTRSPKKGDTPWRTRREAADHVRRSPKTLANLASNGGGPRFSNASGRPLYHINDLDAWLRGEDNGSSLKVQRGRRIAGGGQHGEE